MLDLLNNYKVSDILIYTIVLITAIKWSIDFLDWAHQRIRRSFNKEDKAKTIEDSYESIVQTQEEFKEQLLDINKKINLLIQSDKDDIKSFITDKHHTLCYYDQCVDDYTLDCIEKRFGHYKEEGGNSFVEGLMNEIRALPKGSKPNKEQEEA